MNPYQTLGVDKNASQAEIKKAYRSQAKKHHPDKGGDEAEFKKINEAYEILGNEQKRAQYDQFGSTGGPGGMGGGFGDMGGFAQGNMGGFEDIFSSFFGGGMGGQTSGRAKNQSTPGSDLEMEVQLSFAESITGISKDLHLRRYEPCDKCDSQGGQGRKKCPACNGTGQTTQRFQTPFGVVQQQVACEACGGQGFTFETTCSTCQGEGRVEQKAKVTVKIPAGIEHGTTLRLRAQGDMGRRGGGRGDLYVRIRVEQDRRFTRRGLDLITSVEIPILDAIVGVEIQVETFWETQTLVVPEKTPDHTELRIPGHGIRRDGQAGDHIVQIRHVMPRKISSKLRATLEQAQGQI